MQKNYTKKGLSDPDNHDGVITHLDPETLECEVKWALGSIVINKASGGDGIPAEVFQILKRWFCESAALNMSGNLKNSAVSNRTGNDQFLFQFQRRAMPKNVQTTLQLPSFHMPLR